MHPKAAFTLTWIGYGYPCAGYSKLEFAGIPMATIHINTSTVIALSRHRKPPSQKIFYKPKTT